MGERDEVPAVRDLRVGVDVAEVLHRHRLDARGLQRLGHLEPASASRPLRAVRVVAGDGVERARASSSVQAATATQRSPTAVLVGAREHAVDDRAVRARCPCAAADRAVAWYSSSQGESEQIAASTCETSRYTPRPVRRR